MIKCNFTFVFQLMYDFILKRTSPLRVEIREQRLHMQITFTIFSIILYKVIIWRIQIDDNILYRRELHARYALECPGPV